MLGLIAMERNPSAKMQIFEAIVRRLPNYDSNYSKYNEQLRQMKAGYAGEQRVDAEWKELRFPSPYYLLHDIQLENDVGSTHQIDTLFMCQHFALIVEIKNIKGRIDFDEKTHQCIRTHANGEVEGMSTGVNQVLRHEEYVNLLFKKLGIKIPVKSAIIFAYPSSILGKTSSKIPIFNVNGLRDELNKIFNVYPDSILNEKELKKLVEKLKKLHTPKRVISEINQNRLRQGVLCKQCHYDARMFYKKSKWYCSDCGYEDNLAFFEALHDYRLLESEWISNRVLREYFEIPNINIANKTLKKLAFESMGGNKNREYFVPEDILRRGKMLLRE